MYISFNLFYTYHSYNLIFCTYYITVPQTLAFSLSLRLSLLFLVSSLPHYHGTHIIKDWIILATGPTLAPCWFFSPWFLKRKWVRYGAPLIRPHPAPLPSLSTEIILLNSFAPRNLYLHVLNSLHKFFIFSLIKHTWSLLSYCFQPSSRFDELPDDFDPSGKLPGSFDDGDPQTTNLYVGNLSPQVRFLSLNLLYLYFLIICCFENNNTSSSSFLFS